jgi:type II restriction enzyme
VFRSRKISSDQFIGEFFETLTPGVIPREQFIDWGRIRTKCKEYAQEVEFFQGLSRSEPGSLAGELRDAMLAADEPRRLMKAGFELLGHTNAYYVSDRDNLDVEVVAGQIKAGSEDAAAYCARVLLDLGLENLIAAADLGSAFLGVQVGLESNRRKNVGGEVFGQWVRNLLESTCSLLGGDFEAQSEVRIPYRDSTNGKKVDFAISHGHRVRIGVEVNFYTTPGSKPTEIKRAYQNVNRELGEVGVELVWITDGAGYLKMRRSLEEAFKAHPNTYNYEMARRYLKQDVLDYLG